MKTNIGMLEAAIEAGATESVYMLAGRIVEVQNQLDALDTIVDHGYQH
ncbi:hypothetical protein [Bacillus wiedmannii]|nr:hypothetical protein [Bacillus wiedmannii]